MGKNRKRKKPPRQNLDFQNKSSNGPLSLWDVIVKVAIPFIGSLFGILGFVFNIEGAIPLPLKFVLLAIVVILLFIITLKFEPNNKKGKRLKFCLNLSLILITLLIAFFPADYFQRQGKTSPDLDVLPFTDGTQKPSESPAMPPSEDESSEHNDGISSELLNVYLYCENDTEFADYYVEMTIPNNSHPVRYNYDDFPVQVPISHGYYTISVYQTTTGNVIYEEKSDYINEESKFWVITFQHPSCYLSLPTASTNATPNTPYKLDLEIHIKYNPVLEYAVLVTNNDTGYTCVLGMGDTNDNYFEGYFAPGSYTVHIEATAYTIGSFTYITSIDNNPNDPYRCGMVYFIDYSPLGGSLSYTNLNYKVILNDGTLAEEMFLYIQQPKYTNRHYENQSYQNIIDPESHAVSLVLDRSEDKLYQLFSGVMHGEIYYGRDSRIDEDGTLIIYMAKPSPVPY